MNIPLDVFFEVCVVAQPAEAFTVFSAHAFDLGCC